MSAPSGRLGASGEPGSPGSPVVVCTIAGRRCALPLDAVEAIARPPALTRIPHAGPALLGAASLGGRIMPVVDPAGLLDQGGGGRRYDGSGEIVRLRAGAGSVGIWVDRVERLAAGNAAADAFDAAPIDPERLLACAVAPPCLGSGQRPLGDPVQRVLAEPAPPAAAFILVEAAGQPLRLRREEVLELVAAVPWTPLPRSPPGLLGVALLHGAAVPALSLAALLGLRASGPAEAFALVAVGGRRALLAVDRVRGLRFRRGAPTRRWAAAADDSTETEGEPVDVAALFSEEVRRIVLGFSPVERGRGGAAPSAAAPAVEHLAFSVAGQDCAVPAARVERVVGPQRSIALPRPAHCDGGPHRGSPRWIEAAIELAGQVVPVAALRSRLLAAGAGTIGSARPDPGAAPAAYVVLRGAGGLAAVGVDRIARLVRLDPASFAPPPPGDGDAPIAAIARQPDGGILRVIAPERLWGEG